MLPETAKFSELVTLRDGTRVELRPIRPDDAERLQGLFGRLSPESIYLRFLERRKQLTVDQAVQFATVNYDTTMAIVAVLAEDPKDPKIIGVARYGVEPGQTARVAEAAVVVEDAFQNRGLGTLLLQRLLDYAREHDMQALQATIHQNNAKILHFIQKGGLPTERRLAGGVWEVQVTVNPEDAASEV